MLALIIWWCIQRTVQNAVLDPALYLSPSPPLIPLANESPNLWSQSRLKRNDDLSVVPIDQIQTTSHQTTQVTTLSAALTSSASTASSSNPAPSPLSTTTESSESELMEKSETFWPSFRTNTPYFGLHVPLTFSLSGTYGRYGAGTGGVIGSSYVSVGQNTGGLKLYGKSGLAGSSYGSYSGAGTRIYGGNSAPSWSGWGNGKWGHYGKG